MATVTRQDGWTSSDPEAIRDTLAPLGIELLRWSLGDDGNLRSLLAEPSLDDDQKEAVLAGLDHYFERIKAEHGYQSRDLIVLHPGTPGLDELLAKFSSCHTHDDDEVRYIVDGSGTFGFVGPDGAQVLLTMEAGEYVNVPAGAEHWFVLTDARRVKAVRYFTGTEGWVANYTGTPVRL